MRERGRPRVRGVEVGRADLGLPCLSKPGRGERGEDGASGREAERGSAGEDGAARLEGARRAWERGGEAVGGRRRWRGGARERDWRPGARERREGEGRGRAAEDGR